MRDRAIPRKTKRRARPKKAKSGAKLTAAQVEIERRKRQEQVMSFLIDGMGDGTRPTHAAIAARIGVDRSTVSRVVLAGLKELAEESKAVSGDLRALYLAKMGQIEAESRQAWTKAKESDAPAWRALETWRRTVWDQVKLLGLELEPAEEKPPAEMPATIADATPEEAAAFLARHLGADAGKVLPYPQRKRA